MFYRRTVQPLPYHQPLETFERFPEVVPGFLLESADIAPIYGRLSVMSIDPPLEVIGKDTEFTIRALNRHGDVLLATLTKDLFPFANSISLSTTEITGTVERSMELIDEGKRQQQDNISSVIRMLLEHFKTTDSFMGLYGAFSYDFVRLFEDLPNQHEVIDVPDFHLYLPDILYVYDHLKETAELRYYDVSETLLEDRLGELPQAKAEKKFAVSDLQSNYSQDEFEQGVIKAQKYMKQGDIFEVVLSRQFTGDFNGSTVEVYKRYRDANPSPYMFYFRFGKQPDQTTVLGASPEMFVRVEDNTVMTRPISGTARRSDDPLEDYQNMMNLLNSVKEKSELDMLIDLARNDVSRVCTSGIEVSDYRYVEKYSKVMHTIAHVQGSLDTEQYSAFDAFIACLNAGTLTGAPKIQAMKVIEELEPKRRGYYGGNVGYLTFNNELNTGIIIRSAVIKNGTIQTQAGATLLYDSQPEAEYRETEHKAAAILSIMNTQST